MFVDVVSLCNAVGADLYYSIWVTLTPAPGQCFIVLDKWDSALLEAPVTFSFMVQSVVSSEYAAVRTVELSDVASHFEACLIDVATVSRMRLIFGASRGILDLQTVFT
jgi:hypothetical protein